MNGRPAGSVSILTAVKRKLRDDPSRLDELAEYYIENVDRRSLLWQMIDGRPQQDVTTQGEKIPAPILNVQSDDSDEQDTEADQTD